ncbi:hypothetical protein HPB51_023089 [Rhipicephalus microplus]|uniref:Uncharacterized protein n=1 Tax=Rhipicephalus microplus TaxID=6941 RepID=A0A9J6DJR6_RHIMP|nr:hypothetical protein HPB51_023089 [Rhipicephalus microplus]
MQRSTRPRLCAERAMEGAPVVLPEVTAVAACQRRYHCPTTRRVHTLTHTHVIGLKRARFEGSARGPLSDKSAGERARSLPPSTFRATLAKSLGAMPPGRPPPSTPRTLLPSVCRCSEASGRRLGGGRPLCHRWWDSSVVAEGSTFPFSLSRSTTSACRCCRRHLLSLLSPSLPARRRWQSGAAAREEL